MIDILQKSFYLLFGLIINLKLILNTFSLNLCLFIFNKNIIFLNFFYQELIVAYLKKIQNLSVFLKRKKKKNI